MTDANLLLGRLVPQYFPKIFGKNADESLDAEASLKQFEVLSKEINDTYDRKLTLDEIVYGCVYPTCELGPMSEESPVSSKSLMKLCVDQSVL